MPADTDPWAGILIRTDLPVGHSWMWQTTATSELSTKSLLKAQFCNDMATNCEDLQSVFQVSETQTYKLLIKKSRTPNIEYV